MDDQRQLMVRLQLEQRGIRDGAVLRAMSLVPRHLFLPAEVQSQAYTDQALPIAEGQTMSQPFIVALMAQELNLRGHERVLEVGTGSGYAAAVLSMLAGEVISIERSVRLASAAADVLHELGYHNVHVICGDGTIGFERFAPFDAISVPAAAPWVPAPLREQLAEGGRLVIPVGGKKAQMLLCLERRNAIISSRKLLGVRFVPLCGEHAWGDQYHT